MHESDNPTRDLDRLIVPLVGRLHETGDRWEPYQLIDADGAVVDGAAQFFKDLQARGRSVATQRSYGNDLLRWFRFLRAVDVPWERATRVEARDFTRWIIVADKPVREHWRRRDQPVAAQLPVSGRKPLVAPGSPNRVTGKPAPGAKYAAATAQHSETVLRAFYDFHLDMGTGPVINPFPLDRSRRGGRRNAHHNPMQLYRDERTGLYRPKVPERIPRSMPDEQFNEVFAKLPSHRDRALVAFYVSTGARASEVLGAAQGGVDPGQQLITVTRKGTRAVQQLPASPDAFVWLRLYQVEMEGLVPQERGEPLWWTLHRPFGPLAYHAAYRMFARVNQALGSNWTLHDLRHTAAYRMAEDPALPLTDVQWVLGHASLTTTQRYLTPRQETVIRRVLAHHAQRLPRPVVPPPAPGYRPESLAALFGEGVFA